MRVEGFSKSSATARPASARDERGAAFSSGARSSSASSSSRVELRAGEEMARQAGQSRRRRCASSPGTSSTAVRAAGAGASCSHEFAAALAGWEWDVALLQEVPPWWPPALARAAAPRRAPR